MPRDPVCLVQWLKPTEYREVAAAWNAFSASVNISLHDVGSKAEVLGAISAWLADNDNAQFLYIGAHGVRDASGNFVGLGKDGVDVLLWSDLAAALRTAQSPPVLWLGACGSSAVASAWSPIADAGPAAWVTSFADPIMPRTCLRMLVQSLGDTNIDRIVFLDEELPRLVAALPGINVEQFYPAMRTDGSRAYVSVADFIADVGCDFKTYLAREN